MSDRCPLCGEPLEKWDYGSYYDPPESGERCTNIRCKGYEHSYFYYDGYYFRVGNWIYSEKYDNPNYNNGGEHFKSAVKEFNLRIKYYKKRGSK